MKSLLATFLLVVGSAVALVPQFPATQQPRVFVSRAAVLAAERWSDPILDDSKPDPVYDDETPYLGRSFTGFVSFAETLNGRAAMMGFTILFLQELVLGKG